MSLPTKEKTWNYDFLKIFPTGSTTTYQEIWFKIINSMLSLGSNPWVVKYSGTASTAGTENDGVNRWTAKEDLTWSTGNHSWIVLENVDGFQVLFDLGLSTKSQIKVYVSHSAGFTGGATNSRPMATDEQILPNNTYTGINTNSETGVYWIHHSDDGEVTRIFFIEAEVCLGWYCFEKIKDPTGAAVKSYFAGHAQSTSTDRTAPLVVSLPTTSLGWEQSDGFDATGVSLTGEGFQSGGLLVDQAVTDSRSGAKLITPQSLWGQTAGGQGPLGLRYDIYWGANPPTKSGDTYPDDLTRQFVQLGHWVLPHDGSSPITT